MMHVKELHGEEVCAQELCERGVRRRDRNVEEPCVTSRQRKLLMVKSLTCCCQKGSRQHHGAR